MIFNMQSGGVVPDQYLDAQTITPGTADQVINAGTYLRGAQTIKGDPDLIPANIKEGINIFGVNGTLGASGSYVWKKSQAENVLKKAKTESKEIKNNILPYSASNILYKATSYSFDENTGTYTLDNPTAISGSTLSNAVHMYNGEYFMLNTISGASMYGAPNTSSSYAVTVFNNSANGFGIQTYSNYQIQPYFIYSTKESIALSFIDYVVSDNENEYPDGGVQDGYYYGKVAGLTASDFGFTRVAVDEFTFASDTQGRNATLTHSLGETPKQFLILTDENDDLPYSSFKEIIAVTLNGTNFYSTGFYKENARFNVITSAGGVTATATTVLFNLYNNFGAGVKYKLITMA